VSTNFAKTLFHRSEYDVTNSAYQVTICTIHDCSIREFCREAYHQAVAPGITRPLHATALVSSHFNEWRIHCCCNDFEMFAARL